jgi:hypothetical protein
MHCTMPGKGFRWIWPGFLGTVCTSRFKSGLRGKGPFEKPFTGLGKHTLT